MTDDNSIIQGLWIGTELSVMEQLSVASFLQNGHQYHLYIYDELKNIPAGTVIKDANEILPSASIFQYQHSPSYAGFANFFRYKLILERGGWWADTDTICLKPFDFPEPYVFSSEMSQGLEVVASAIFKTPAQSEVMAHAWEVCQTKDPERLVWGETGPKLMGETVKKHALEKYIKRSLVFCPLGFFDWHKVLEPDVEVVLEECTFAIHLWNERWRAAGQNKNAQYDENCFYEQLKRKYLRPAGQRGELVRVPLPGEERYDPLNHTNRH
jgi:mannosyltransferase OCH1-like enzyme